jgi:hypothetical protein
MHHPPVLRPNLLHTAGCDQLLPVKPTPAVILLLPFTPVKPTPPVLLLQAGAPGSSTPPAPPRPRSSCMLAWPAPPCPRPVLLQPGMAGSSTWPAPACCSPSSPGLSAPAPGFWTLSRLDLLLLPVKPRPLDWTARVCARLLAVWFLTACLCLLNLLLITVPRACAYS